MKTIEFTYTDAKGKTSERTLLATTVPGTAYEGIDVSSMSDEDFAVFAKEYSVMHEAYLTQLKELQAKFDLTHNYRRFLVERMSNVSE